MDLSDVFGLASIPVLVLVNGFFVAAEFALVTIRRTEIDDLVLQKRGGALAARRAVERLDDAIAATQLGITIASLALGWLGETALARVLSPALELVLRSSHSVLAHSIAAVVALAGITCAHVILGELAPKTIALQRTRSVALFVARPLVAFMSLLGPPIRFMNGAGSLVVRALGLRPLAAHSRAHSVDELRTLVDETRDAGILHADQADAVKNIFRLRAKIVRDVMVPLERVAMLDLAWPLARILEVLRASKHTRIPVFSGDRTLCVGIANVKDLYRAYAQSSTIEVAACMRPAAFIAPEVAIADLLRDMKRYRRQIAIVRGLDERAIGVVTLQDILDEIVGEIGEEADPSRSSLVLKPFTGPSASTVLAIGPLLAARPPGSPAAPPASPAAPSSP